MKKMKNLLLFFKRIQLNSPLYGKISKAIKRILILKKIELYSFKIYLKRKATVKNHLLTFYLLTKSLLLPVIFSRKNYSLSLEKIKKTYFNQ